MFKKSKLPVLSKYYLYSLDRIYILNILLIPLSIIYFFINLIKRVFFSNNKINTIPVIVIGNLTVGGTGKTSLVIWLCNHLTSRKYKIGVISGGYKTNNPYDLQIVGDGAKVEDVGDEAILIKKSSKAIVCKCKDRKKAYEYLVKQFDLDIIISDDGLSHYNLKRDLNLVIVKENRPFGNGLLLPAGPLREPPSSIKRYENVIVNKNKKSNLLGFSYDLSVVKDSTNNKEIDILDISGSTMHLVTAIANPDLLIKYLNRLNIDLITHIYPDHYIFQADDFRFEDDYKIIMTEKDFIKASKYSLKNTYYLPTKINVDNDIKIMLNDKIIELLKV